MKEELKKYLKSREKDYWYGCDSDMMCKIIDEFFEQYEKGSDSERAIQP